jgi:hypothetical protein
LGILIFFVTGQGKQSGVARFCVKTELFHPLVAANCAFPPDHSPDSDDFLDEFLIFADSFASDGKLFSLFGL